MLKTTVQCCAVRRKQLLFSLNQMRTTKPGRWDWNQISPLLCGFLTDDQSIFNSSGVQSGYGTLISCLLLLSFTMLSILPLCCVSSALTTLPPHLITHQKSPSTLPSHYTESNFLIHRGGWPLLPALIMTLHQK